MLNRAYAFLTVKAADDERRLITGTASTPEPDRMGDIIEPLGITYSNPVPLLLYHDPKRPVGTVKFEKPTAEGLDFEARLPLIDEAGTLRDRVEEAWQSIKAGLLKGVSIGFRSIEEAFNKETMGFRFLKTEVLELSLVAIPANADATISAIKRYDLAAMGHHSPGASGTLPVVRVQRGAPPMKTYQEQIAGLEASRAAKSAELETLQKKATDEGRTKDEAERERFTELRDEIKAIDAELADLREIEKLNQAKAVPITNVGDPAKAAAARSGAPVITVKANVPAATVFTRYIMAIAAGKGDYMRTMEHAKQWIDQTPEVVRMVELQLKAAVAPGTTTDATWAGPLVTLQPLVNEFLELLRPRTFLGRIPGLRPVPFNVSVPSQTGGGTYGWVGQNKPKPVTSATFATVSLTFAKAAGIIVLTEELVRTSKPSAEETIRQEMIAGISQFLDQQFIDPAVAAVAGVNPASITNGAPATAASGVTGAAARADIVALINAHTAAGIPLEGSVLLMSEATAFALGVSLNALAQPLFPGVTAQGGTVMGVPIITSANVGNRIVLVHAPSILFADDGGVSVDVSREASLQMDSAPTDPTDATTVLVSLWQRNLVGLRAERYITWLRARTGSVRIITGVAYNGT